MNSMLQHSGWRWRVIVTTAGVTHDARVFPADVLQRAVQHFNGVPVWRDAVRQDHDVQRDREHLIGFLSEPRFTTVPTESVFAGGVARPAIEATLNLFAHREDIRAWLLSEWAATRLKCPESGDHGYATALSFVLSDGAMVQLTGRPATLIRIGGVAAVDVVGAPATAARIIGPAEDDETMMLAITESLEVAEQPAPEPADAVDAAAREIDRWHTLERDLSRRVLELDLSLAQVRAGAADAVIAATNGGPGSAAAVERIREVHAEIDATYAAIEQARDQRRAALAAYWRAKQPVVEREATALIAEAEVIESQMAALQAQLEALAGTPYVQRRGPDIVMRDRLNALVDVPPESRPEQLRDEATAMMRRQQVAFERWNRDAADFKEVGGKSVAELLMMTLYDRMVFGPTLQAIREWAAFAEQYAMREQPAQPHGYPGIGRYTRTYRLVWQNGQIDANRSRVDLVLEARHGPPPVDD